MVFSKSVGKTLFLYTDQADITDFSVKRREELCPLRGVRVQNISNLDLEKAMNFSLSCSTLNESYVVYLVRKYRFCSPKAT